MFQLLLLVTTPQVTLQGKQICGSSLVLSKLQMWSHRLWWGGGAGAVPSFPQNKGHWWKFVCTIHRICPLVQIFFEAPDSIFNSGRFLVEDRRISVLLVLQLSMGRKTCFHVRLRKNNACF